MNKLKNLARDNFAWCLLAFIVAIFTINSPVFISFRNITNILNQNAYLIVSAIGVCFVMMSGNMDLSVGYAMSINGVVTGLIATRLGWNPAVIVIIAIFMGMFLTGFNVILSHLLKISYMFVTFGTMTIYQGLAYVISNSKTVSNFPENYKVIGQANLFGTNISAALVVSILLLLLASFVLNKTYFGRYVFALGGNKDAARLAGIDVNKMELAIGFLCGAFCGLGSVFQTCRLGSSSASTAVGIEFTIITGLLLGGVSVRGGSGKISGCVAGLLIIAILGNGMQLAGLNVYYQYVIKGIIMLATIGVDTYQITHKEKLKKTRVKETQ